MVAPRKHVNYYACGNGIYQGVFLNCISVFILNVVCKNILSSKGITRNETQQHWILNKVHLLLFLDETLIHPVKEANTPYFLFLEKNEKTRENPGPMARCTPMYILEKKCDGRCFFHTV